VTRLCLLLLLFQSIAMNVMMRLQNVERFEHTCEKSRYRGSELMCSKNGVR